MPTPDEIIRERIDRIETIPNRFINAVSATQPQLFAELMEILSQLLMDNGKIVLSEENLLLLDELTNEYYIRLSQGKYGGLVANFIKQIDDQKGLIDEFTSLEFNAVATAATEAVFLESRKIAVRQLLGDDFKTNFINVVKDQVVSSIDGESTFNELRQNMIGLFENGKVDGQIVNWVNQVASDRFSITDRAYSEAIDNQVGAQFVKYSGGLIQDSRQFCIERDNKYYHINEVRSWASQQWQGRYRRTTPENILHWLGGYRCQHLAVGRSLINVPRDVIGRNIANGNFTPTAAERALLGLEIVSN